MNENYNNSAEGNDMRKWLDVAKSGEKRYIIIPVENLEDLWATANSGIEASENEVSSHNFVGQVKLIKHLYEKYGKSNRELAQIITEEK